ANAVRVGCINRLNQILAHQVSAVIGAAESLQRAVLQGDRLEFRENRLAQLAPGRVVHPSANQHGGCGYESDDDQRDADGRSFDETVLHRSRSIKTILML